MAEFGQHDVFNLNTAPALPKGKACVTCRLRKIKCDGARPVCTQCREAQRAEDCEYVAVRAPSSTHALEKRVAALRARVKDLQTQHTSGSSNLAPPHASPQASVPLTGGSGTSGATSEPITSPSVDLSREETELLIRLFFAQNQPLWFLDSNFFRSSLGLESTGASAASSTLLLAMGAATASHPQASSFNEPALTGLALSRIGSTHNDSAHPMHAIQAHVLLGAHLLRAGRFTQGLSLLSDGLSFALALGLHRPEPDSLLTTFRPPRPILPTPNPISAGEHVRGFWTIFVLERLWAMALGTVTRARLTADGGRDGGMIVNTLWPEDATAHQNARDTLSFLRQSGPIAADGNSALTLSVKATLLLERSYEVASQMAEDSPDAHALDERINSFATALGPPLFASRDNLLAHILLRGATLQLHSRIPGDPRAMSAARALAAMAPVLRPDQNDALGMLEPAIGIVIPAACRALIAAMLADTSGTPTDVDPAQVPMAALEALQGILGAWQAYSAYIGIQLNRVLQERIDS
ncbi:unnamed protein product [Peniophora sp. CBMAI 1063]|nr:unnamed protein product [Peniophora sp. CBMAI 1063]